MLAEVLTSITALAQPSVQTAIKGGCISEFVQQDASSWTIESLNELDALLSSEGIPRDLRPTSNSYFTARKRLIEASGLLNSKPDLILDGEGGIDIEWETEGCLLMYACRANLSQQDYVYFQSGEHYGGDDYSPIYSTDRLNWLLRG